MCIGNRRRSCITVLLGCAGLLAAAPPAQGIRVVTYNIANYSSGRVAELQLIFNALQPDILVVQEMNGASAVGNLLNVVLNGGGGPGGYLPADFADSPDTEAMLFYKSGRITFTAGDSIQIPTSPRWTPRWRLGLHGYTSPGSKLYVYGMHLKAGSTQADKDDREAAAILIRTNANTLPAGTNFILAGDYNIQASSEASYGQLTGTQPDDDGRAFDPINMPGTWNANMAFAMIHTQSPHLDNPGAPPGATGGGMDDRFDFLLVSAALNDNQAFACLSGTYRAYGNDGQHFNKDINDPPVIPQGAAMADALHAASDHLPVYADFKAPPVISTNASISFGTVVVNRPASANLTVTNVGSVSLFTFVDALDYSLAAPPGFSAPAGNFVEPVGVGSNTHVLGMDTSTPGPKSGNLVVNSDDPDNPARAVPLSGAVLPRGDLNQDFAVDPSDVAPFVALLLDPGSATPLQLQLADMNQDGGLNGHDVTGLVDAVLGP